MLSILLLALAALAVACNPSLNDFKYLGNDTHSTLDLIQHMMDHVGMGWTEVVTLVC